MTPMAVGTRTLYEVDQLPIFQNRMYHSKMEAVTCPKGDMRLVEDLRTGLIYNEVFSPALMVYDENYQNEQAVSPLFQRHLEEVANAIDRTMGRDRLVEVGCGKGHFLETLLAKNFDVTGFDPVYEGTNPRVKRQLFESGVFGQPASGLVLRHVLEHIQNPVGFLEQLKAANGGTGKIYIEVPCFDWICEHHAWFDIFYEHVNYFRKSDFHRMFGEVLEIGRMFGGQYLYVVAELSSLKVPSFDETDRVNFPTDFTRQILEPNQDNSGVWGGASKGVIFALLKTRAGQTVSTVIDINPEKQGKFLPGTGLEVKSPIRGLEELAAGATLYIMNSNYLEEIKEMSGGNYHYVAIDQG